VVDERRKRHRDVAHVDEITGRLQIADVDDGGRTPCRISVT